MSQLILNAQQLYGRLPGNDPFIFAGYLENRYPQGNGALGPEPALLAGRDIGMDFSQKDGWSMYHGEAVPGFPAHPHTGFETVTIVRRGLIDHADSLGGSSRYGEGDVQWLTTGRGVEHGEMFPLVHEHQENVLDLYQIWLNLPASHKQAPPGFTMLWANDIPHVPQTDAKGRRSEVIVVAGDYAPVDSSVTHGHPVKALAPPADSWASQPGANVAIWIITLEPGASLTLPAAVAPARRTLYLVRGKGLALDGQHFDKRAMVEVDPAQAVPLHNEGSEFMEILLLQGQPIGEPVVAQGPFVANSETELAQALQAYQRLGFGPWPWPTRSHTFGQSGRFAKYPDGREEQR